MLINTPEMLPIALKERRCQLQKSQTEIAQQTHIRQATISHMESQPKTLDLAIFLKLINQLDLELHLIPKQNRTETNENNDLLW